MDKDSFKRCFSDILKARNNYDLFGPDMHEDLHWGKLFLHLFGECYSKYSIRRKVNNQELIKSLIKRYSLRQSQPFRGKIL